MKKPKTWIGTIIFESYKNAYRNNNASRLKTLIQVLEETKENIDGDGILIFPAGYFNTGTKRVESKAYFPWIDEIQKILGKIKGRSILVCLGIDGAMKKGKNAPPPRDQLGFAIDKNGILAIGRKFYPIFEEKKSSYLAQDHMGLEQGHSRIFLFNGRKYYLAVCYDIFGIKHNSQDNPGVDAVLNFVHKFTPRCQCTGEVCSCNATSGDVYFPKNGFAGASKQWGCPVFGSVYFMNRDIPGRWPSGVFWNKDGINTRYWKYTDNPIKPTMTLEKNISTGKALMRYFILN